MDFARKLAVDLEEAGYDVWWDISDLRGGDDWVRVIPAAIESSQHVLVVLSPNSIESEWVEKEYTQALSLHRKIIPIMLAPARVPFALNTINYVNFTSGDYFDNLKNLLSALGYTGEPPVAPPIKKWMLSQQPALRKYSVPLILGIVVLLVLMLISSRTLTVTPTVSATPSTIPSLTFTPTHTPTATAIVTLTATTTLTPTQMPTLTSAPTKSTFETLTYCVNSPYAYTINVRSGPGTNYAPLGEPLLVGKCLAFSARNEEETWLQIAPNQPDAALEQYMGGWIFRELLGLGSVSPIDLPAVTLTPTPTPSTTPTITATFTNTSTATLAPTPTDTPSPIDTNTPISTDTLTP